MKDEIVVRGTRFTVTQEEGLWWASSESLPGTTVVGRTRRELERLCREMIDFRKARVLEAR